MGEIEKDSKHYIISTHASFRWHKYLLPAFDFFYLSKLSPDIFITIMDSIVDIKKRLENTKHWKGRLTLRDIIIWKDEEIFVTKF